MSLSDIPVAKLSEDECVVELRRLRAFAVEQPTCEFADITNERMRATLCRETGECGCIDSLKRETEIVKRLIR